MNGVSKPTARVVDSALQHEASPGRSREGCSTLVVEICEMFPPSTISRGNFEKSDIPSCRVLSVESFKVLVQLCWLHPDEIMQGSP